MLQKCGFGAKIQQSDESPSPRGGIIALRSSSEEKIDHHRLASTVATKESLLNIWFFTFSGLGIRVACFEVLLNRYSPTMLSPLEFMSYATAGSTATNAQIIAIINFFIYRLRLFCLQKFLFHCKGNTNIWINATDRTKNKNFAPINESRLPQLATSARR